MKNVIYLLLVLNKIYLLLQKSDIPSSNKYTSFKPATFICSTKKSILLTFISLNNAASLL